MPNLLVRQERLACSKPSSHCIQSSKSICLYELLSEDDDSAVVEDYPYDVDWGKYDSMIRPWGEDGAA